MQRIIDIIQNIVGIKFVKPFVVFKKLFEAIPNITAKNKYRYPERFISISRRWIANSFMRKIFLNALYKSLDTISR
mgnify:CR=1 FL=1